MGTAMPPITTHDQTTARNPSQKSFYTLMPIQTTDFVVRPLTGAALPAVGTNTLVPHTEAAAMEAFKPGSLDIFKVIIITLRLYLLIG